MLRMLDLQAIDINKTFIVIDKTKINNNMILEYIGIDSFGEKNHLSHKFRYSYNPNLRIYHVYYPISCQECYMLQPIVLPFDVTSIINMYLINE